MEIYGQKSKSSIFTFRAYLYIITWWSFFSNTALLNLIPQEFSIALFTWRYPAKQPNISKYLTPDSPRSLGTNFGHIFGSNFVTSPFCIHVLKLLPKKYRAFKRVLQHARSQPWQICQRIVGIRSLYAQRLISRQYRNGRKKPNPVARHFGCVTGRC